MGAMINWFLVLTVLLFVPQAAQAETSPAEQPTKQNQKGPSKASDAAVQAIKELRDDLPNIVKQELEVVVKGLATRKEFKVLTDLVHETERELRALKADYEKVKDLLQAQLADQRRILEAIS